MAVDYDNDENAAAIEAAYRGHDVVAQRAETLARLAVQPGEHVLDVGAGPGFLAMEIADQTGPTGRVLGIDIAEAMIRRATARNDRPWLSYALGDATGLPVEAASFDAVVSTQVAEYMTDLTPFCAEIARVLKPGGRTLILTTDWDGLAWHSEDPDRMARVLEVQRGSVAQSNVPRILAPYLQRAGLEVTGASCFEIVNLDRRPGAYSEGHVKFTLDFVREHGDIREDELSAWADEQETLEAKGAYFFSVGRYIFEARKPA
ncbi:MAG: methyltransferase domain-containing protein [Pseudomonadota bacterium]